VNKPLSTWHRWPDSLALICMRYSASLYCSACCGFTSVRKSMRVHGYSRGFQISWPVHSSAGVVGGSLSMLSRFSRCSFQARTLTGAVALSKAACSLSSIFFTSSRARLRSAFFASFCACRSL